MLWRALESVEQGFWIDVGAAHPTEDSVTRAFYDRGWHGVNIEPELEYAAMLQAERPRDINLQVAIGATSGRATFHRISGTGLSTFDAGLAANHAAAGHTVSDTIEVEVTTLAAVCAAHAASDIHFLKIDAEGAEREVLLGADLRAYRPWIIVAEATVPSTSVPRVDAFADLLIAANYRQCWFDGINAFFLAAEHEARLAPYFLVPPNAFDGFMRADHVAAVARAQAATARAEAAITRAEAAEHRIQELGQALSEARIALSTATTAYEARSRELNADVHRLEDQLSSLHCSTSWRLTAPLRATARLLGKP
jgi:FkbM family methyltransferase